MIFPKPDFNFSCINENITTGKSEVTEQVNFLIQHLLQERDLTDDGLFEVAAKLSNQKDIYRLGLKLGLQHPQIQSNLKNHHDEITMAAYHMLRSWMVQHQDRKHAFALLVTALKKAELQIIVDEVLYGS